MHPFLIQGIAIGAAATAGAFVGKLVKTMLESPENEDLTDKPDSGKKGETVAKPVPDDEPKPDDSTRDDDGGGGAGETDHQTTETLNED